jgi:O-antigen/teichoic acid export membrane protein
VPRSLVSSFLRGRSGIAVAMGVMSLATYGFTVVAARILGPEPYGAVASLMATLLVIGVIQLGLQATAARRIAAEPEHVAQIERAVLRVTYRSAATLGGLLLLATPVLSHLLRLDSWPTAALVAVAAVPLTVMGGQAGILQGERRWLALSAVYVAAGVPRLLLGAALMWWHPTEWSAMLGVAIAAFAPVAVGWWVLRSERPTVHWSMRHRRTDILREVVHNSVALFAFFALSNADVIVARNVLDAQQAGLYAGGLIMTKAVLFLPQFVVVIAFPSMSTVRARRRALVRGLTLAGGLGLAASVGAAVLSELGLVFVGGAEYTEIRDRLWVFALLGTALAMLQLLVYSVLARRGQRSIFAIWAALAALVAGGSQMTDLSALLVYVLTVDAALLTALFVASLVIIKHPAPETEPVTAAPQRA